MKNSSSLTELLKYRLSSNVTLSFLFLKKSNLGDFRFGVSILLLQREQIRKRDTVSVCSELFNFERDSIFNLDSHKSLSRFSSCDLSVCISSLSLLFFWNKSYDFSSRISIWSFKGRFARIIIKFETLIAIYWVEMKSVGNRIYIIDWNWRNIPIIERDTSFRQKNSHVLYKYRYMVVYWLFLSFLVVDLQLGVPKTRPLNFLKHI